MVDENREEDRVQAALANTDAQPASPDWLEPIYREHAKNLLRAAYRITGNATDAEDVLQTVFLRLARREHPPDLGKTALPYLRRAATNAALDLVESRRTHAATPLEAVPQRARDDSRAGPERIQLGHELHDQLRRAEATLNRRSAEMFVMRYFEGLDNRDIAEAFTTSPGTVAVTLHRARTHLMNELRPYLEGAAGGMS